MKRAALGFTSALALAVLSAAPAHAGAPFAADMANICGNVIVKFPCIYDSKGQVLGILFGTVVEAKRQINGAWYIVRNDAVPDLTVHYMSYDCTGQRYIQVDHELIPHAEYDGASFWGPDRRQPALINVRSHSRTVGDGQCFAAEWRHPLNLQPAVKIETQAFVPPFEVQ